MKKEVVSDKILFFSVHKEKKKYSGFFIIYAKFVDELSFFPLYVPVIILSIAFFKYALRRTKILFYNKTLLKNRKVFRNYNKIAL